MTDTQRKGENKDSAKNRPSGDLIKQINEIMPELSRGQKQIAKYVIANSEKAGYLTASALGNEVGVSESTVVRFAIALGFDGYPDLQNAIKDTIRVRMTSVQRMNAANVRTGDSDIVTSVLTNDAEKIKSTLENIDKSQFAEASDLILNAKNIYILGMRSSAALAEFANYYFGLLFDNVRLIRSGGSEIFEHLMKVSPDDVLIAISFPRYTTGIVNAVEYASDMGAKVVALTDSVNSPIVPRADAVLIAQSDMASFIDSLVAPMSTLNALIALICSKKQEEFTETLTRLETVWKNYNVYTNSQDN